MKFGTDNQGVQEMHLKDFGDHLTLPLVPPSGQNFDFNLIELHIDIDICGFEWNSSTTLGLIAMKFGSPLDELK